MTVQIRMAEDDRHFLGRSFKNMIEMMTRGGYYRYSQSTKWSPALNIYEDDDYYLFCVELPGLKREQIQVEVHKNRVRISGERPIPPIPQGRETNCIICMEIDSGPFERLVELPHSADMHSVDARLEDGFLWIRIAKQDSTD